MTLQKCYAPLVLGKDLNSFWVGACHFRSKQGLCCRPSKRTCDIRFAYSRKTCACFCADRKEALRVKMLLSLKMIEGAS